MRCALLPLEPQYWIWERRHDSACACAAPGGVGELGGGGVALCGGGASFLKWRLRIGGTLADDDSAATGVNFHPLAK